MSNNYDFQEISNDVEGFWTGEGSIIFKPQHAHLCDNGADKSKCSTLIVGELVEPCEDLVLDKEPIEGEPGMMVGVWYSPGMRPILQCAGVVTRLRRDPTKDKHLDGRPKPMKGFGVDTPKAVRGSELQVAEDYRKQSRGAATPFDEPKRTTEAGAAIDDSDVPFA